jgi:hypothetical protein
VIVRSAADKIRVQMAVITSTRKVRRGVTIQASGMAEDLRDFDKGVETTLTACRVQARSLSFSQTGRREADDTGEERSDGELGPIRPCWVAHRPLPSRRRIGRTLDRTSDTRVRSAPTQIRHGEVDLLIRGPSVGLQQRSGGHQHTRLTVAALGHLLGDPSLLKQMRPIVREPFDGRDRLAVGCGDRERTRPHRITIDMERAGSAPRDAAPELRAAAAPVLRMSSKKAWVLSLFPVNIHCSSWISISGRVWRRLESNRFPVGAELVGQNRRKGRADPLTELCLRYHDRHPVIRSETDPRRQRDFIGPRNRARRADEPCGARRPGPPHQQPAANHGRDEEERPARQQSWGREHVGLPETHYRVFGRADDEDGPPALNWIARATIIVRQCVARERSTPFRRGLHVGASLA